MADIFDLDKMRIKFFCALLDVWAHAMAKEDDSDSAGKIGTLATVSEEIKGIIINRGTKGKLQAAAVESIRESEILSSCKTDERTLNKIRISIEKNGLKNPPVVRRFNNGYQLMSGSLQYEACKKLDLEQMKVFLKDCSDDEAEELSLLDAFTKSGLQNLNPSLVNMVLRFYNTLLN